MGDRFRKAWHDPVWSNAIGTVISAGILAAIAAVARILWGPGSKFLGYGVPLWLVLVICAGAFIVSVLILSKFLRRTYGFAPQLKLIGVDVPDPDPNQTLSYPVKCY